MVKQNYNIIVLLFFFLHYILSYQTRDIGWAKADLKATKSANNIEKYGKKAILEQDADLVVFEFEEITPKIQQEINKLNKRGIHGLYFIKGNKNITPF